MKPSAEALPLIVLTLLGALLLITELAVYARRREADAAVTPLSIAPTASSDYPRRVTLDPQRTFVPQKFASPTAWLSPTPWGWTPCDCAGPDLDCADFPSQSLAQQCFDWCWRQGLRDVFRLDHDRDGRACSHR